MKKKSVIVSIAVCMLCVCAMTACRAFGNDGADNTETVAGTTVTFMVGGDVYKTVTVRSGRATAPADPTKAGYTFVGWYEDETFNQPFSFAEYANSANRTDITVYAYFVDDDDPNATYRTVTFDPNGGSVASMSMQFAVGKIMSKLPIPRRSGYTFLGWADAIGMDYDRTSVMPDEDLSLRARWEKEVTEYDDSYVTFKPATEGVLHSELQDLYGPDSRNPVDKFVYVKIKSDDLGGADTVGEPNNFNLRSVMGMQYAVKSGYQWTWYEGGFDTPNGAQRFTLRYGSNIQFVTVSDGSGVVVRTYLVDIYVLHDYYISLYTGISSDRPYDSVRVTENGYFSARTAVKPAGAFEFDARVYYNEQTQSYQKFDYTTAITKDWALYQTYKPYNVPNDPDGGTLEKTLTVKPYERGQQLPIPTKAGYDFLGWQASTGNYFTDTAGYSGVNWLSAGGSISGSLKAIYAPKRFYYSWSDNEGRLSFHTAETAPVVTYTDASKQTVAAITYVVKATPAYPATLNNTYAYGEEVTLQASQLGYTAQGWYERETELTSEATYTFTVPNREICYTTVLAADAEMSNYTFTSTATTCVITGVKDKTVTEATIPGYVTGIGDRAFSGCGNLTSVEIPDSVTNIGRQAFENCSSLTGITVVAGNPTYHSAGNCLIVTHTKTLVAGCKTSIIPTDGSVTSIGDHAFSGCDLTSIAVPAAVTMIEAGAFNGCGNLTSISIPFVGESKSGTSNTHFGYIFGAESYRNNGDYVPTSLRTVVITGGESIADNTFSGCSDLTRIEIPSGVKRIGNGMFSGCSDLANFDIPAGVTSIGNSAFSGCSSLTSITIPDSVSSIGSYAFKDCSGLTSITIPFVGESKSGTSNTHFGYIFGASSSSDNASSVPANLRTVVITGGESIGQWAFTDCVHITDITIPAGVTSIGDYVFRNCSNLARITVAADNPTYRSAGNCLIDTRSKTLVAGCNTSIIPADGSVIYIKKYAFSGCRNLTSIEIPNSVQYIRQGAFRNCSNLTSITIPFVGESKGSDSHWHFGFIFGANSYDENHGYVPTSLKSVVITGQTVIRENTFYRCDALTSITIRSAATSFWKGALSGCSNLTSITLPFVGDGSNNTHFGYIFGASSFSDNDSSVPASLQTVAITGGKSIGSNAFRYCNTLINITLANGVTSIGSYAFSACGSLTNITIPNSVSSIGSCAFEGCSSLTVCCEAASAPSGWDGNWNPDNRPVTWGYVAP